MNRVKIILCAFVLNLSINAIHLTAKTKEPVDQRFSISLSSFITDRSTKTRYDSPLTEGTNVDFEGELGLDRRQSVFRIDGHYKLSKRHRVDFGTFDLSRSSSTAVQEKIRWGQKTFEIDTVINTQLGLSIYKAAYTYSLIEREKGYLGVTGGLYTARSKFNLAEEHIGEYDVVDFTTPLPVIGLRGEYKLAKRWTARASAEFFIVDLGDINGSLADLFASIDYRVSDHVSLGVGANTVNLNVNLEKEIFRGSLDWRYSGLLMFIKLNY